MAIPDFISIGCVVACGALVAFAMRRTAPVPSGVLTPGPCECGHIRCCHTNGIGGCNIAYPNSAEWPDGSACACKVYIFDPDADDDDDETPEPTPTPQELERMYRK